jgi:G patch domain-containing protein 1
MAAQRERENKKRERFHGAFTGGFSAGYHNTVGSEAGWQGAQQFVSSRSKRADPKRQKASDFMDEEDGLLGATLVKKSAYDDNGAGAGTGAGTGTGTGTSAVTPSSSSGGGGFARPSRTGLLLASSRHSSSSIGARLMSRHGWRPGQGVGPRTKALPGSVPDGYNATMAVTFAPREVDLDLEMLSLHPRPLRVVCGVGYDATKAHPELHRILAHSGR